MIAWKCIMLSISTRFFIEKWNSFCFWCCRCHRSIDISIIHVWHSEESSRSCHIHIVDIVAGHSLAMSSFYSKATSIIKRFNEPRTWGRCSHVQRQLEKNICLPYLVVNFGKQLTLDKPGDWGPVFKTLYIGYHIVIWPDSGFYDTLQWCWDQCIYKMIYDSLWTIFGTDFHTRWRPTTVKLNYDSKWHMIKAPEQTPRLKCPPPIPIQFFNTHTCQTAHSRLSTCLYYPTDKYSYNVVSFPAWNLKCSRPMRTGQIFQGSVVNT